MQEEKKEDKNINIQKNIETKQIDGQMDYLSISGKYLNDNINLGGESFSRGNLLERYTFLANPDLLDSAGEYISSYLLPTRPELSDYTKEYLESVNDISSSNKAELSNLTKAYLNSNGNEFNFNNI